MNTKHLIFSEGENSRSKRKYDTPKETLNKETIQDLVEKAYKDGQTDAWDEQKRNKELEKKGREEGIKEQAKEKAKQQRKVEEKVETLAAREDISLLSINSFFPFDPFPDTLHIDTTKITIINREFISTEQVITISFKDILDIVFEKSLFLANLNITYLPKSEGMGMIEPKTYKVQLLKCEEARKAKNILKGMLLARREGIDVTQIKPEELTSIIERFGESDAEK